MPMHAWQTTRCFLSQTPGTCRRGSCSGDTRAKRDEHRCNAERRLDYELFSSQGRSRPSTNSWGSTSVGSSAWYAARPRRPLQES